VRQGRPRRGERLNLVETLRAATPWQMLRGGRPFDSAEGDDAGRVQVRSEDFRLRRFVRRSQSTTIVVVDASGSAAFQRLAEAKGAVELLLARAYVSRARVALIAFRGKAAELLLPPTRSLTRAKRRLADLPGGGGTPLAAGMDMALALAKAERAQERTPILVFLTDGQANIGLDGAPGRPAAEADAMAASVRVRQAGVAAAWLDTSPRPRPGGDRFAKAMGAAYRPLPYANAQSVTDIIDDLRPGAR
jgi:magnesium chelatase subunit D